MQRRSGVTNGGALRGKVCAQFEPCFFETGRFFVLFYATSILRNQLLCNNMQLPATTCKLAVTVSSHVH